VSGIRSARASIAYYVLFPAAVAIAASLIVHALVGAGREPNWWQATDLIRSFKLGFFYVGVVWMAQRATFHLLEKRSPIRSTRQAVVHVCIQCGMAGVSFAGATVVAPAVFQPTRGSSGNELFLMALVACGTSLVVNTFIYMGRFMRRTRKAEADALRAELSALRAQINPHFLFNALNTIAALTRRRPAEAEKVTEALADLFRYSLRASQRGDATVMEEVECVERYLEIEQARFRDRLNVTILVEPELESFRVPSLVLQPLVENAVKHGAGRVEGVGLVTISIAAAADAVQVRVEDNGRGFGDMPLEEILARGSGLSNVRARVQAFTGNEHAFRLRERGVELLFRRRPVA
jgi:signal transduction histidine kinase